MPHILLTGAGFSRNWGGWLATEAFEYLLGCPEINTHIHTELWKSKNQGFGFENTLEELRKAFETYKGEPFETNLRTFERMLESMFNSMNNGFKQIEFNPLFDPHTLGHPRDFIRLFLSHFDAIFTLNQDCLLELKYNDQSLHRLSDGRWRDMYLPGVQPVMMSGKPFEPPGLFTPAAQTYQLEVHRQPYFKLHGSSNFREGESPVLIMGGNKGPDIDKHWLLRSYRDHFAQMAGQTGTRLMIIGYSFADHHINELIEAAVNAGAKLFIVDVLGIDVLDNAPNPNANPMTFRQRIYASVLGASRRQLISTFSNDHVEHAKLRRFLHRLSPGS
jgi:SIR2-like domain